MDIETIFAIARDKASDEERTKFLDEACGMDEELRARIEELLRAHGDPDSFLDGANANLLPTMELGSVSERPGAQVGRYRLLEQIGEGGFGVVFMAEQQKPVHRKVALKIIKPGMDSKEVIARFEAERQALAMMDHPNIAKVLDAGATDSARPYFVMELVRGVPITTFCDTNKLSTSERLVLFATVCQAVQHAHQKGIIHRDIKPSNVLVTMYDDKPVPKVIDFGVAKATNVRLTERTLFTRFAQLIGTPLYMSPEQAQMSGLDIDTRSDIYSLGVLLYELLTGTTPFDQERVREAAHEELVKIIREEEPPAPSVRISSLGETLPTVAALRGVETNRLSSLVRGELDWIVMKAIEKDRKRRYETAIALAEDVQHYLHDEPVTACPPSAAYRFNKFARRNKVLLSTTCLLTLALLLGLGSTIWQAVKANAAKDREQLARITAQEQRDRAIVAEQEAKQKTAEAKRKTTILRRQAYIADMNVAIQAWSENDVARVRRLLQKHVPAQGAADLRQFEWHYLWRLCSSTKPREIPLDYPVAHHAFSPNDSTLAVGCANRSYILIDTDTETRGPSFGPANRIWSPIDIAISPDGRTLAYTLGRNVKLCRLGEDQEYELEEHQSEVAAISFSPDGRRLVSREAKGIVRVWDVHAGQLLKSFKTQTTGSGPVAWSPTEDVVAVGCVKNIEIWNPETAQRIAALAGHSGWVAVLAFSPDGGLLASGANDNTVRIWNWRTEQTIRVLHGHADHVLGLAVSPNGEWLASGGRDNIIKIWEIPSGNDLWTLKGHSGAVTTVAFSHSGDVLASSGFDRTVLLWDVHNLPPQDIIRTRDTVTTVTDVAFSPDGRTLASINGGDRFLKHVQPTAGCTTVDFWDVESMQRTGTCDVGKDVFSLAFNVHGLLAVGGDDGSIELWNWRGRKRLRHWGGHKERVRDLTFSPDGALLASGCDDGEAKIWRSETGELVHSLNWHGDVVQCVRFSPDGNTLATASHDFTVGIWDVRSGARQHALDEHRAAVLSVDFSPNGQKLATCSWDGTLNIWDLGNIDAGPKRIAGHSMWAACVRFSPDGGTLFSAAGDRTVKLWDVESMQQKIVLNGHTKGVLCIELSPDGHTLASGSRDGTIRLWRSPRDEN